MRASASPSGVEVEELLFPECNIYAGTSHPQKARPQSARPGRNSFAGSPSGAEVFAPGSEVENDGEELEKEGRERERARGSTCGHPLREFVESLSGEVFAPAYEGEEMGREGRDAERVRASTCGCALRALVEPLSDVEVFAPVNEHRRSPALLMENVSLQRQLEFATDALAAERAQTTKLQSLVDSLRMSDEQQRAQVREEIARWQRGAREIRQLRQREASLLDQLSAACRERDEAQRTLLAQRCSAQVLHAALREAEQGQLEERKHLRAVHRDNAIVRSQLAEAEAEIARLQQKLEREGIGMSHLQRPSASTIPTDRRTPPFPIPFPTPPSSPPHVSIIPSWEAETARLQQKLEREGIGISP
jgi:hypothetical protein